MIMPNREEFIKGCEEFKKHERRDAMYKVATDVVKRFWGNPADMADGLGVLLLTWNHAFYRYGVFDFYNLEKCIANNLQELESFRKRDIFSMSNYDENNIKRLFNEFLIALQIDSGKLQGSKSPVAVAKALHLLAPNFFPLWDKKIAESYGFHYSEKPAEKYISFCKITKDIADKCRNYINIPDKTLIKLIDEYNYSKYTQGWI